MYAISADRNQVTLRYSFPKRQWQSFAKVNVSNSYFEHYFYSGATALLSKVYVLYGRKYNQSLRYWEMQNAVLHCFDPASNRWVEKASTCHPHLSPAFL